MRAVERGRTHPLESVIVLTGLFPPAVVELIVRSEWVLFGKPIAPWAPNFGATGGGGVF